MSGSCPWHTLTCDSIFVELNFQLSQWRLTALKQLCLHQTALFNAKTNEYRGVQRLKVRRPVASPTSETKPGGDTKHTQQKAGIIFWCNKHAHIQKYKTDVVMSVSSHQQITQERAGWKVKKGDVMKAFEDYTGNQNLTNIKFTENTKASISSGNDSYSYLNLFYLLHLSKNHIGSWQLCKTHWSTVNKLQPEH